MDRICPFLALSADHRTAIDGYDPDHLCHAQRPPELLDRARQAELCLADSHRQCEFYLAYLADHSAATPAYPLPAPDTHLPRTRLILEPEARRLAAAGRRTVGTSPRRWLVAGAIAAVGVAVAATVAAGGFDGLVGAPPPASTVPASVADTLGTPLPAVDPTPDPTAIASAPRPTASPTPTPRPQRTPGATPEQQRYVVRDGDTLSTIASRFGTSVAAIKGVNGLGASDVINVGQVLVIP